MLRFYIRRVLWRVTAPIAFRWYTWLFGAHGVEGGDGRGCKTILEFGTVDPDPRYPDRPPMICLQIALAVVPGPRIVARTFISPADALDFMQRGQDLVTEQMKKFSDVEPRRFDTSQVVI